MQSDLGKLFVGGISWDTDEERMKEYFSSYGEVLEAVIMKDRNTGRARGFGFIVFADPAVAEKVVLEKHNIDGRMVEAKKAVPRDDQSTLSRNGSSVHGSPVPGRTRKIFVGGLASSVTDSDFKAYFEQFGAITDVVVMYDHNTQRPRGFGFITFDSEEAVDAVLTKTFHELNGKMVEVKRAVPKELSPASSRSPLAGFNYGMSRTDILGGYNLYSPTAMGGFGFRMDGRFSPMSGARAGLSPFGSGYGMGMNYEPGINANLMGSGHFNPTLGYGRGMSPHAIGNNRFSNNLGYAGSNVGNNSLLNSPTRNLWGNNGLNFTAPMNSRNSSVFMGSGSEVSGNAFGGAGIGWGSSQISAPGIGRPNDASNRSGNFGYGIGDNNASLRANAFGISVGTGGAPNSSYGSSNVAYDGAFTELYTGESVYGDSAWRFANSDRDGYGSLGEGVSASSDMSGKGSAGYIGSYGVASRQANQGPPSHGGLS